MKKKILLGVTGGIAAYKSANIVSQFRKKGYDIKVIMTKNATEIITPLTLETLSRNKVYVDMWDKNKAFEVEHIELATWADIVLIAPATYNIVGKVASGICDDMLTTVIAATEKKVYFALAMNHRMYTNPILEKNIIELKKYGYNFIEADEGFLACNVNEKGRLKKEEDIIEIIEEALLERPQILKGKKILITASRTEEPLDPIRYISNLSSGKMGYSLASACVKLGGEVTLITGPSNLVVPSNLKKIIKVRTALEMYTATLNEFSEMDIAIACAAVGDYRPQFYSLEKIKKKNDDLIVNLERNPDILFTMGEQKKNQILIGFAAETENIRENAFEKLKRKNLDAIVANHAFAMQKNLNSVNILMKNGEEFFIEEKIKDELAFDILSKIFMNI
ncbi:MAG: bifunctional phosphopantothenoylcysteine decarboxylase/phosphopantothenate--cysteine ligase CoaBC [Fusobacteriaceae bacterium]